MTEGLSARAAFGELTRRAAPILYLCADAAFTGGRDLAAATEAAVAAGADIVQLREKTAETRAFYETALAMRVLTRRAGVLLLINDRTDIALAADADGVHLGQTDMPAAVARALLGENRIVGVSARAEETARAARRDGADYLGTGPVFATRSKAGVGEAIGFDRLRAIREASGLPVIGIGGIDADGAGAVIEAGAAGVAVISAILAREDAFAATRSLRAALDRAARRTP